MDDINVEMRPTPKDARMHIHYVDPEKGRIDIVQTQDYSLEIGDEESGMFMVAPLDIYRKEVQQAVDRQLREEERAWQSSLSFADRLRVLFGRSLKW